MGDVYRFLREDSAAEPWYLEALERATEIGETWSIFDTQSHLGWGYANRGELSRAGDVFADALRMVRRRGEFMQDAVPAGVGAMAAILGLAPEAVEAACREAAQEHVVAPANFNSPEQTVIAGHADAVARAAALCTERGAKRAVPLPVSAPFHCSLMAPARRRMQPLLEAATFSEARFPVVTNVAAAPASSGEALRDALVRQIDSPVRWVESVRRLAAEGVDRGLEIGPGNVLSGLVRRIDKGVRVEAYGG